MLGYLGEAPLRAADVVQALASSEDDPLFQALSGSYATVRRFLPALLAGLAFEGAPSAKSLLDAWHFLQAQEAGARGRPKWTDAPRPVVPKRWARQVFPGKDEVNPAAYTLCILDRLHQTLRRREVFVAASERYGDPRAELLRGDAWEAARESVARALDRSLDPAVELARLQTQQVRGVAGRGGLAQLVGGGRPERAVALALGIQPETDEQHEKPVPVLHMTGEEGCSGSRRGCFAGSSTLVNI